MNNRKLYFVALLILIQSSILYPQSSINFGARYALIIGGIGVSAGAAVALVTGVRRSRAKRLAVAPRAAGPIDPEPPAHPIS